MDKVLILGKGSYIGEALYAWLRRYDDKYEVKIASTLDHEWEKEDFDAANVVVNLAGIAHINNITNDMKEMFYSVNKDLAIQIGEHAKKHGVSFFIQFSSMNVYGDYCENIIDLKEEKPANFYGDSKLQGDIGLRSLEDDKFLVACVRPPFVYGKGCKGNYNVISKIAKHTPIFPEYQNKKSMIYIDNLCEFVRLLIEEKKSGIYAPQNKELVSTTDLVRKIARQNNKKIWFTTLFNWLIPVACRCTRVFRRAFSNDCYDIGVSNYFDFKYSIIDFETSIVMTEER